MRASLLLPALAAVALLAACGKAELEAGGRGPRPATVSLPDGGTTVVVDPGPQPDPQPPAEAWTRKLYVATSGSDSAPGTPEQPYRTLAKALASARPGDLITVRAGSYSERVVINASVAAGTAEKPIRLQGEGMPKLVPSGSGSAQIHISRPHWQVAGFEVDMKTYNAFAAEFTGDVTGSVLSDCNLHHGSAGGGVSTHAGANGATIQNNEIHHFRRSGDSHGVIIQPPSKNVTVRANVIYANSGDSVQCIGNEEYYAAGTAPAQNIVIADNDMSADREQAVDIKTCHNVTIRNNVMHDYLAALPGGCAMVVHYSARDVVIEGNTIRNVGRALAIGGNTFAAPPTNVTFRRNKIENVVMGNQLEGSAVVILKGDGLSLLNNSFHGVDHSAIHVASDGVAKNVTIKNNIFRIDPGATALYLGAASTTPGLQVQSNLYWPAPQFSVASGSGRETLSLEAWRTLGRDTTSRVGDPAFAAGSFTPSSLAVDWGEDVGLAFCGSGPDVGAVETGCAQ